MLWSLIQQLGTQAIKYGTFVILAALLAPQDFGLVALATVWLGFQAVFAELGFSAALIQRSEIEPRHLSSTFFLNVAVGALLMLLGIGASWPLAQFYNTPQIQPVIALLSIEFLVDSFSLTQIALAQRTLRFRDLAIRDIGAAVIGGVVGIIMAWRGYGVWSLVAQALVNGVVSAVLLWGLATWRPRLSEVSWDSLRDLWGFSSQIFLFNFFKYLVQNVDKFLVGYLLGASALGLYTFAYRSVVFPMSILMGAVGIYLFPKYARMQDNLGAVRTNYLLVLKVTAVIAIPSMIAASILSPLFVPVVFKPEWLPAVPLIQLFAFVAIAQAFVIPIGQVLKAFNRPGWLFNWSVISTILTVIAILLGTPGGIEGVALAILIVNILSIPVQYWLVTRLVPLDLKALAVTLAPALIATLGFTALLGGGVSLQAAPPIWWAGLAAGLAAALYLVVLLWLDRSFVTSLVRRFRDMLAS